MELSRTTGMTAAAAAAAAAVTGEISVINIDTIDQLGTRESVTVNRWLSTGSL